MPYGNGMDEEIKLQKIEYYRQVKPPTLAQYVYRRAVREAMGRIKGKVGVTVNPGTGIPIPESALAAQEAEWREDYEKDISSR